MSEDNMTNNINNDDPLDIGELVVLNEDISADFIEQLQGKIVSGLNKKESDADLFEEISETDENSDTATENVSTPVNTEDDEFIKKYKARLKNQDFPQVNTENIDNSAQSESESSDNELNNTEQSENTEVEKKADTVDAENKTDEIKTSDQTEVTEEQPKNEIENLTSGNIKERPATQEQIDYNKSLSELDDKNYKKYIIYIDSDNVEFIENLSLKERKNLFNKIIKEQDCISNTKSKCYMVQTVIRHIIIAIFTLSISIPILYYTLNASLETSINNYKKSQSLFSSLYKSKGKIQNKTTNIK